MIAIGLEITLTIEISKLTLENKELFDLLEYLKKRGKKIK